MCFHKPYPRSFLRMCINFIWTNITKILNSLGIDSVEGWSSFLSTHQIAIIKQYLHDENKTCLYFSILNLNPLHIQVFYQLEENTSTTYLIIYLTKKNEKTEITPSNISTDLIISVIYGETEDPGQNFEYDSYLEPPDTSNYTLKESSIIAASQDKKICSLFAESLVKWSSQIEKLFFVFEKLNE
ncbi:hypothetical protein M9Y10_033278 [Tritrichomonas musculus]|uniref:Uncharacterized protein n=1 Tax=Tritrichomonas musculus TaxID=1915356 RepID=A0ABR2KBR5_9EUKA